MAAEITTVPVGASKGGAAEAEADLHIEEQDVREHRAQHYPHRKPAGATGRAPT